MSRTNKSEPAGLFIENMHQEYLREEAQLLEGDKSFCPYIYQNHHSKGIEIIHSFHVQHQLLKYC